MTEPLISICIPNFNNGKYLDVCIRSALKQTYPNIEVIFVDDCSDDESMEVARKYADRIRIFRNESNMGQPRNTNRCIDLSRGKYLVILHSDDQLLPHFAEKLVRILESHPEAGIAVGERMETDETGIPSEIAPFYTSDCIIPGEKQAKVFMLSSFLPCQVLIRRETLEKAGPVDERHIVNLDGLLWFKCALAGDVGYTREPVAIYRIHGESTTAHYNRTINHMIEYYCTLSEMFRLAKGRPYLEQFFDVAVKRVAQLSLRYSHAVLKERNFDLVSRYLALATVFDPSITDNHTYKTLKYCVDSDDADPLELYGKLVDTMTSGPRNFSYEPPDGFRGLDNPVPVEQARA
ncbi:MAG: glycosyltransferase [Geobacteraceae bacterium]